MAAPTQGRSGGSATGTTPHVGSRSLHARDRHELEIESGIHQDVIAERGAFTCPDRKTARLLGFSKSQQEIIDAAAGNLAMMLPVHAPNGTSPFVQMKGHVPRVVKGKERKYEQPAGVQMAIDSPPRCHPMLGNPNIPAVFTEGIKKGDAGAGRGMCMLALIGVWNFRGRNDEGGKTVVADLDDVALNERVALIVFDSDVMRKYEVYAALERFSGVLKRRGAEVLYAYLPSGPNGEKVGLDDWLTADPARGLDDLMRLSTKDLVKPAIDPSETELRQVTDALPGAPGNLAAGLVVPLGYELGAGGVAQLKLDRRSEDALEERRISIAPEPIFIAGRLENVLTGEQWFVLVYRQGSRWVRKVVERSVAMDARKLVSLSGHGFPTTSGRAGGVVEYLADFEAANINHLPASRTTPQLGFQPIGDDGLGYLWGEKILKGKGD